MIGFRVIQRHQNDVRGEVLMEDDTGLALNPWREIYPEKFASEERVFGRIRRENRIYISTG